MELTNRPPAALPQQTIRADLRPTADAAAVARNPQPSIPLPIPATMGPLGVINQSRLSGIASGIAQIGNVERVLKPYGVAMLPYGPGQNNVGADSAEDEAAPAIKAPDTA